LILRYIIFQKLGKWTFSTVSEVMLTAKYIIFTFERYL